MPGATMAPDNAKMGHFQYLTVPQWAWALPLFISKLNFSCDKYSVDKACRNIHCHFYFRGVTLSRLLNESKKKTRLMTCVYITFSVLPVFSSTLSSSISVPSIREPLRVRCSAKGSPLPTVTWYKNDVSLPVINKITADEFISELVIGEFQPADQATYKCVTRNVYNNTVETSTRICKSLLYVQCWWKFFFWSFSSSWSLSHVPCSVLCFTSWRDFSSSRKISVTQSFGLFVETRFDSSWWTGVGWSCQ